MTRGSHSLSLFSLFFKLFSLFSSARFFSFLIFVQQFFLFFFKMNDDFTPPYKAEKGKSSGGDGKDELVDCELEAAQALACLAHPGSSGRSEEAETSSKGMMNHEVPTQTLQFHEQVITIQSNQESEPKTSPQHALRCPPGSSRRSRQNLTEEEKEERRHSRILANRESARQTIRRRQAMYEELTRKAVDLALENENLKKKRELAAKEFDSLKNQNASLRLQISKTEKAEAEETDGASRSKPVEISITSTAPAPNPTALFNQPPILPFFWPSIVQPFNLLQCSTQNISDIASVVPSPTVEELNSINRQQSSNPGQPLYVLPFPCLIPFHPQSNPFLPWASTVTDRHAETPSAHQCSTSYVSNQAATTRETEAEAPDSIKATQPGFLHEAMLGFPPCRGASEGMRQPSGVRSREMVPTTHQREDTRDTNAVSCTAGHVGDTSERTSQESITCSSEKTADAIAAAEARKRRKELLHLKGHH